MLALLVACHDYGITAPKAGPGTSEDSAAEVTQDSAADTAGNDGATTPACEQDWPDREVSVDTDCPDGFVEDWDVREVWTWEEAGYSGATVHAGRFDDDNGDGVVDASDRMSLGVQVFANASGGWVVEGADVPSPGVDLHPGMLDAVGAVPSVPPLFFEDPATNVWQGLPLGTEVAALPDLEVGIEAVCAEGCEEDLYVTVYVANAGSADAGAVDVVVRASDGAVVASGSVAALAAGSATAVTVRVPVRDAVGGLEAEVDPADAVAECDESDNAAPWADTPCP